ncbi:hypothetical protein C8J56DRAFT_380014 [Mycena floridula]|nr:hypothetical protein C8J56DRAFT_380014 [Mycena floridula]
MERYSVIRAGPAHLRKDGMVSRLLPWKKRWLVLTTTTLIMYETDDCHRVCTRLAISDLVKIEQSSSGRRCLILSASNRRTCCIAFEDDIQLYAWHEAIYNQHRLIEPPNHTDLDDLINDYYLIILP